MSFMTFCLLDLAEVQFEFPIFDKTYAAERISGHGAPHGKSTGAPQRSPFALRQSSQKLAATGLSTPCPSLTAT